jgi:hypothetical protein
MREGGASLMDTLSYVAIGILVVAIIFMLVPVILIQSCLRQVRNVTSNIPKTKGGTMDSSMPALGATSKWNATYNTALKTGSDFWQTLSPFILIAALSVSWNNVHRARESRCCDDCGLHRQGPVSLA